MARSDRAGTLLLGIGAVSAAFVVAIASWPDAGSDAQARATDPRGVPLAAPDQRLPDAIHLTCTAAGAEVEDPVVEARPGGVVLVVDSTLPPGSYVTYDTADGGSSGGAPIPSTPEPHTYGFPPGEVVLGCGTSPDMEDRGSVTVRVEDPDGHWRTDTLADRGCSGEGAAQPSWIGGLTGTGESAQQAVDRALDNFATETARRYTAEPASVGYIGATSQTWIASDGDDPALTIEVTRTDSGYRAHPDRLCG